MGFFEMILMGSMINIFGIALICATIDPTSILAYVSALLIGIISMKIAIRYGDE